MTLQVRCAEPRDAPAVVSALERALGRSHFDPTFYDAPALAQEWSSGRLRSWLAVDGRGVVRAHGALCFSTGPGRDQQNPHAPATRPTLVEYGHAFTDPAERHRGLATAIGAAALGWARSNGVREIYSWALTLRPFAQSALREAGGREMCLLLAMNPPGINRGYLSDVECAIAAMLFVVRLQPCTERGPWYIPARHHSMVSNLMRGTAVDVRLLPGHDSAAAPEEAPAPEEALAPEEARPAPAHSVPRPTGDVESALSSEFVPVLRFGVIEVHEVTGGVGPAITTACRRLTGMGANVTYLDLDPTRPAIMALVEPLAQEGFGFAGIHPNYTTGRLRVRLQRLSSPLQPPGTITVASRRGAGLVDHVLSTLPADHLAAGDQSRT